jgi:O-antigen ligase
MSFRPWREAILSPGFALIDFLMVAIGGGLLCLFPGFWYWCLLIALIPWGFRIFAGLSPVRLTTFDWLIAIFVGTACAGYWASYDGTVALNKLILILASVLLYYTLGTQPEGNLVWVSYAFFLLGFCVSVYFFLTHDFLALPRKVELVNEVGRWIMQFRPSMGWESIHPNYVSGIAAITSPFIFYPLWAAQGTPNQWLLKAIAYTGLGVIILAILMTTSRGVFLAIGSVVGVWVLWRMVHSERIGFRLGNEAVFPSLVLFLLFLIIMLLYLGPATLGGGVADAGSYGDGSRAELFARSLYLVGDFPFTGGGLGAYPALYSHYMLGIPYYYLPNAHNLFLDVFIEQGIPGGAVFLVLYVAGIWRAARGVATNEFPGMRLFSWLVLSALVMAFVHGMVDDYLYNGKGTFLSMVPLGLAAIPASSQAKVEREPFVQGRYVGLLTVVFVTGLIFMNLGRIRSAWYANLGAVQMSRAELTGFPSGRWAGLEIVPELASAETTLLSSSEADPANRTANHRLGLIAMLRRDFPLGVAYLEAAHTLSPGHRGISKALGYGYVWLGDYEQAQTQLMGIPEASAELGAYIGWWQEQGRSDLSERASTMRTTLDMINEAIQP